MRARGLIKPVWLIKLAVLLLVAVENVVTDRQNDKTTTITLAAHARRGLIRAGVMESEIIKREDYAHFKCYDYLEKNYGMLAMVDAASHSFVQKLIIQIICVLLYILNIKLLV